MKDNIVYWLISEYINEKIPISKKWKNEILQSSININSLKNKILNNSRRYVIMTDNIDILNLLNKEFISNNIILIPKISNNLYNKEKIYKQIEWIISDFGKNNQSENEVFVIGDCHFWHKNIIRYCNRPWYSYTDENNNPLPTDEDVVKMNEDMISSWNSVVKYNSQMVYINGDFCFGNKEKVKNIFDKLNGKKRLILGNHDKLKFKDYYDIGFDRVYDKSICLFDFCILSHEPMQWVNDGDVMMNVYAHVHTQEMYRDYTSNSFCTSTERLNYKPISFKTIFEKCKSYKLNR